MDYSKTVQTATITTTTTKTNYLTAQEDGILLITYSRTSSGYTLSFYVNDVKIDTTSNSNAFITDKFTLPLSKGDVLALNDDGQSYTVGMKLYKYKE